MDYNYIVIEGNIGAGKTSLARMIAHKHHADIILEQYADNPFLPKFYKDPGRYSFSLEMSFLATRYHQLSGDLQRKKTPQVVADYAISKSLVFSRTTLQPDEFKLYQQLFDIISSQLPTPDLYVYLYLPADQLLKNIQSRGREYEVSITKDYLEHIHQNYVIYLKSRKDMRILYVDRSNIDFIGDPKDYDKLEEIIFNETYNYGISKVQIP